MTKRLLCVLIFMASVVGAISQVYRAAKQNKKHPLHLKITEINNTNSDEVTRFGVDLISIPHTSSRIDSAQIRRMNGDICVATDIDGVDFNRYFQWEDEGTISIEVDFPLNVDYCENDTLVFYTVYGAYRTVVKTD